MREGGILRIRSNAARSVRFSSPMLAESPKEAENSSLLNRLQQKLFQY